MSYRTLAPKPLNASLTALLKRSAHIGLGLSAFSPVLALANPTGGTVIAGSATITNPNANGTVVKETSAAAIIDWQQFNIGKGQYVQFLQPSSSSIILNRVIGGAGSSIYGSLTGNGQIFLVNTNGVFFGKGSSIDAQGFLASTLDISDTDFLARNFVFDKSGSDASVINQGSITAHKGGYVVLAGDYTENDGVIAAQSGHIILASGTKSTLTLNGNSLVSYAVDQATLAQLAGVDNAGKLEADGGTVIMTADVANLLKATVVNNTGLIEATSLSNQNGVIQLLATGGNISNAGTLDVDATQAGQQGGSITLKGDAKTLLTDTSKITATGDGADGGRVEVSGDTLSMRGALTLGKGGKLLIDPNSIELVAGSGHTGVGLGTGTGEAGQVGIGFIETQLNAGASVDISAHARITRASSVTAITATTGVTAANGVLKFKTGHGGGVELHGMDIDIAGILDIAAGSVSVGHLTAKSIDIVASTGYVELAKATVNSKGVVTVFTADATGGNLNINAHTDINMSGGSAKDVMALQAKDNMTIAAGGGSLNGLRIGSAKLSAKASSGGIDFSDAAIHAGSVAIAAGRGFDLDSIDATGNVTVTAGATGAAGSNESGVDGEIRGKNITITNAKGYIEFFGGIVGTGLVTLTVPTSYSIYFSGSGGRITGDKGITINGGKLLGVSGIELSAPSGNIKVGTGIGTASEHYHNSVSVHANGTLSFGNDIYVQGGLTLEGKSLAYTGSGSTFTIENSQGNLFFDAPIGTAKAPAKYNVDIVNYGGVVEVANSIYVGSVNKHAANISIQQAGSASGATYQAIHIGNSSSNSKGSRPAVTLSATKGNITISGGPRLIVGGTHTSSSSWDAGQVNILAGGSIGLFATTTIVHPDEANAKDDTQDTSIVLKAGKTIEIGYGATVIVGAGSAIGSSYGGNAVANANLSITAGSDVNIAASGLAAVEGGIADASVKTSSSTGKSPPGTHTVTANANLSITAGGSAHISGAHAGVAYGFASADAQAGSKTTDTLNASATVAITAGKNIEINGGFAGGDSAAVGVDLHGSAGSFLLSASGAKSVVNATLHTDMSLKAGGSIEVSGHQVFVTSGEPAGTGVIVKADGAGAAANLTATGLLTLTANGTGGINLFAGGNSSSGVKVVDVGGGIAGIGSSSGHGARNMAFGMNLQGVNKGKASATVTNGVTISTKGDLNMYGGAAAIISAGNSLFGIHSSSGANVGAEASVTALAGGAAALTVNSGINVSAKDVMLSGGVAAIAGGRDAGALDAVTGNAGTAAVTIHDGAVVTATGNVTLENNAHALAFRVPSGNPSPSSFTTFHVTAVGILGGDSAGLLGSVNAAHGGKASLTVGTDVTVKAGGDVHLSGDRNPYGGVAVKGGDRAAAGFFFHSGSGSSSGTDKLKSPYITVGVGGGTAAITATATATVTAKGDVTMAAGSLTSGGSPLGIAGHAAIVSGRSGGFGAQIDASQAGDKATLTVASGVNIKASTGELRVNAQGIDIGDGSHVGSYMKVLANGAGAVATVNLDGSVNLTAGGSFIVGSTVGNNQVRIGGGGELTRGADQQATNKAAVVVNGNTSVNVTAKVIAIAAHSVSMAGGSEAGSSDVISAGGSGHVTATLNTSLNLKAATSINVQAHHIGSTSHNFHAGFIGIGAGTSGGGSYIASNHGVAKVSLNESLNITAGKGFTASASFLNIDGGGRGGAFVQAKNGGSGDLALNQSANITAASVHIAGFSANLQGGSSHILEVDGFPGAQSSVHYTPGKFTGSIDGALNIKSTVTDVDLDVAFMDIHAGDQQDLFVGTLRYPQVSDQSGQAWQGGGVTLTDNSGVNVTSNRDIHISAESVMVQGMYGNIHQTGPSASVSVFVADQANVNGGSTHATAKLTLLGNAVLTAKRDIDMGISGNLAVFGGSLENVRADHASGNVTILASADAFMKAGRDVNIESIGGSLTVAGVGVNASHSGAILADAHGNRGVITVTAHADAGISAARNIDMRSSSHAASNGFIGGSINVVAGQAVDAVTKGSAANEKAVATANATISAGGNVTLIGHGDLNVLGGNFGSLDMQGTGSGTHQVRSATLQAKAGIISAKILVVSVTGDALIAGGDSLSAKGTDLNAGATATGSADVSTTLSGATVSLTVDGNFRMRAGGSGGVSLSDSRGPVKATVTANNGAAIKATDGNVTLALGTVATGSAVPNVASFSAGNASKVSIVEVGDDSQLNGTLHGDVQVTATGNLTLTANGILNVMGGNGNESGALVVAGVNVGLLSPSGSRTGIFPVVSGKATATITGQALFTAGNALTVTVHSGGLIAGGSHAASSAFVQAVGSHDSVAVSVNTSVVMQATKGLLTVSNTKGTLVAVATLPPSSGGIVSVVNSDGRTGHSNATNKASANVNASVILTGKTVNATAVSPLHSSSASHVISGSGVVYKAQVLIGPNEPTSGFAPLQFHTLDVERVTPGLTVSGQTTLGNMPTLNLAAPAQPAPISLLPAQGLQVNGAAVLDLSTLQSQAIVISLVTLLGTAPAAATPVAFNPSDAGASVFPHSCEVMVVTGDGPGTCQGGGR